MTTKRQPGQWYTVAKKWKKEKICILIRYGGWEIAPDESWMKSQIIITLRICQVTLIHTGVWAKKYTNIIKVIDKFNLSWSVDKMSQNLHENETPFGCVQMIGALVLKVMDIFMSVRHPIWNFVNISHFKSRLEIVHSYQIDFIVWTAVFERFKAPKYSCNSHVAFDLTKKKQLKDLLNSIFKQKNHEAKKNQLIEPHM